MTICGRCKQPGEFRKGAKHCKVCDKADRAKRKDQITRQMRRWTLQNPHRVWANGTIRGHRKKGFDVWFSAEELAQKARETEECAICGIRLQFGPKESGKCSYDSPTLDRTDGGAVMTLENTQITCLSCNTTKGGRTMEEFVRYCEFVAGRFYN